MGWFTRSNQASKPDALRETLFAAAEGDEQEFERICRANSDRIFEGFQAWLSTPRDIRGDPEAVARYGRGLIAVADWFSKEGRPQLWEALEGSGGDNPIRRWETRFGEADRHKIEGRFKEAIAILNDIEREMGRCQGRAIQAYLPMVRGSLGECFFRTGLLDRAYDATRAALDGCMGGGDIDGVIAYCGNLSEIASHRGKVSDAKYWLIVATNAMIQAGHVDRAAQVRRAHGLEPVTGLIEVKGPSFDERHEHDRPSAPSAKGPKETMKTTALEGRAP